MENKVMIAALDSLGVPYTLDNVDLKSFVDLVAENLMKQGIHLKYVNLCSLGRNKTWELNKILDRNYTVEDYIKFNKYASEYVTEGRRKDEAWTFPTNPNFTEQYYIMPDYKDEYITTMFKQDEKPIFLYTCGGMNIRSYLKIKTEMNPSIAKDIAKEVLLHTVKHIRQTKKDVEETLVKISNLNPNAEIYVLGVYAMLDDQKLRDMVTPIVKLYNYELNTILKKYPNMHYVDITEVKNMVAEKDMHPTYEGQKYIAKQVEKVMSLNKRFNVK